MPFCIRSYSERKYHRRSGSVDPIFLRSCFIAISPMVSGAASWEWTTHPFESDVGRQELKWSLNSLSLLRKEGRWQRVGVWAGLLLNEV